jgi:hypothetical protein
LLISVAIKTSAIEGERLQWIQSFSDHAMLFGQLETYGDQVLVHISGGLSQKPQTRVFAEPSRDWV